MNRGESDTEKADRLRKAVGQVMFYIDAHLRDGLPTRGNLSWTASHRPDGAWHFYLAAKDSYGERLTLHVLATGRDGVEVGVGDET